MAKKRRLFSFLLPFLAGLSDPTEYKKKHSSRVKFNNYYRYHDKDRHRRLQAFCVHGEYVMAYSKKDAIKRWVHMDLKNRRKAKR